MRFIPRKPEDLRIALGQCFWIGINGTTINDPSTKEIFGEFQPGGIVLFQRNVESVEQVQALNTELRRKTTIPLFLSVDQEGGPVERLHDVIGTIPPAMALASAGSRHLAYRLHTAHARILRALGFNVNFTPVLDLAVSGKDNGLGTRCLSDQPKTVALYAREILKAHQDSGVLPCGKHFPGLGDTGLDSHVALPTVARSWKRLLKEDLVPYRMLLDSLPFIMVNHALYPDQDSKLPASLSGKVVTEFLLRNWNYSGLSISDDLNMGAVTQIYNLPEACEWALMAGNHLFLVCRPEGVVRAYRRMLSRAAANESLARAVYRSAARILAFKFALPAGSPGLVSISDEIETMKRYSDEISERCITKLSGQPIGRCPDSCTVYVPRTKWIRDTESALSEYLRKRGSRVREHSYPPMLPENQALELASASRTLWNIVVTTGADRDPGQSRLLQKIHRSNKRLAVIHGGFPVGVQQYEADIEVAAYWTAPAALAAAGKVILGEQKARGRLSLKKNRR